MAQTSTHDRTAPAATDRLPVTVVAGRSGARVAALVRHLAGVGGTDVAVLQDRVPVVEGGDVVPDRTLEQELAELCGGCARQRPGLAAAVAAIADRRPPPRHLLVELPGGAPSGVIEGLLGDPAVRRRVAVDAVVVAVDVADLVDRRAGPPWGPPARDAVEEQLAMADHVVVRGADDLSPHLVDAALWAVRGCNASAPITVGTPPDPAYLLGVRGWSPGAVQRRLGVTVPSPPAAGALRSSVVVERPLDEVQLAEAVAELRRHGSEVWRVEAVLPVAGNPRRRVVSGAGPALDAADGSAWGVAARRGRIDVVGRRLDAGRIVAALHHGVAVA
jgi:cobalamin biosynthesis protein CobW